MGESRKTVAAVLVVLLMAQAVTAERQCKHTWKTKAALAGVSGGATYFFGKAVSNAIGFLPNGVGKDTVAALWQSVNGEVKAKSPFSVLQKIGAKGVDIKSAAAVAAYVASSDLPDWVITSLGLECELF